MREREKEGSSQRRPFWSIKNDVILIKQSQCAAWMEILVKDEEAVQLQNMSKTTT